MKQVVSILIIGLICLLYVLGKAEKSSLRRKCNQLMFADHESKSPEYKHGLSKLPFEVLYYYNYGKMEYCLHNGKLED
jgi:hypothetical protein